MDSRKYILVYYANAGGAKVRTNVLESGALRNQAGTRDGPMLEQ